MTQVNDESKPLEAMGFEMAEVKGYYHPDLQEAWLADRGITTETLMDVCMALGISGTEARSLVARQIELGNQTQEPF